MSDFERTAQNLAETVLTLTRENQELRTAIREWAAAEDAWAARDEASDTDALIDALVAASRALGRKVVARDETNEQHDSSVATPEEMAAEIKRLCDENDRQSDWPEFRKLLTAKLVEAFDNQNQNPPLDPETVRQAIEASKDFQAELKRLGLTVEDDEANDRDDLTTAYMAGFEKGRDVARDEAAELREAVREVARMDAEIKAEFDWNADSSSTVVSEYRRRRNAAWERALGLARRLAGGEEQE